jgi:hypothetical protein
MRSRNPNFNFAIPEKILDWVFMLRLIRIRQKDLKENVGSEEVQV